MARATAKVVAVSKPGLIDRTLANLRVGWRRAAGAEFDAQAARLRPDLPDEDRTWLREAMRICLESGGGEVATRAKDAALGHVYLALDHVGRCRFLKVLVEDFDVNNELVYRAMERVRNANGNGDRADAERALRAALVAPRAKLLARFHALPEGVKFVVDLRAEIIALARIDPSLSPLVEDLKSLLGPWFDADLLELRRITWENAPAALLEKLIANEAVHAIRNWDDLKNRLDSDRRCFAYVHPAMPDEPLVFVEVALVRGLADNIHTLLDETAPAEDQKTADTAIFYSISNAQRGLAGIHLGSFLITRVIDRLRTELPGLKTFLTLSPMPGFMDWLAELSESELMDGLDETDRASLVALTGGDSSGDIVVDRLSHPQWCEHPSFADIWRSPVTKLGARYLAIAKAASGRALDPVADFHLGNGARLERLNWLADTSPRGLGQSAGLMVNYVYDLDSAETHHEPYVGAGRIATSSAVARLLKDLGLPSATATARLFGRGIDREG
ncbi:MAG: malonyl-CoA decarboxylase [Rhodospirillales bacterium]|nr:malonyl-CoA decarboxylase [Rhodospirillales bacterium]